MLTTKKSLSSLLATVFVACLALPGIASATWLDLTTASSNPLFAADFASGSVFNDPTSGLAVTITASAATITTSAMGLGVLGGGTDKLNDGEWIEFGFVPNADLLMAVVLADAFNLAGYIIDGSGGTVVQLFGGQNNLSIVATANSLRFTDVNLSGAGQTPGYTIGYLEVENVANVPEPAVLGLLGLGLLGVGGMRRRKKTA